MTELRPSLFSCFKYWGTT